MPYGFKQLVIDLAKHRRQKRLRITIPRLMVLSKSQALPTSETHEYTRAELLAKFDDLLNRAVDALKNGEISAAQVSEIETLVNRAIARLKTAS